MGSPVSPSPSISKASMGCKLLFPASMAGLPAKRAWVGVKPPLSCNAPKPALPFAPKTISEPVPMVLLLTPSKTPTRLCKLP